MLDGAPLDAQASKMLWGHLDSAIIRRDAINSGASERALDLSQLEMLSKFLTPEAARRILNMPPEKVGG